MNLAVIVFGKITELIVLCDKIFNIKITFTFPADDAGASGAMT